MLIADRMSNHAVRQVFAESREVPLWERLTEIPCPVLVIRGGRKGALVNDDLAEQWQSSLPTVELATVADAGHDLWSRDVDAYLAVLLPFLERVERGVNTSGNGSTVRIMVLLYPGACSGSSA